MALDAFARSVLVLTSILLDFKYQSSESASQVVILDDWKRFLFSPSKKIALASPRKSYDLLVTTTPFLIEDFSCLLSGVKLNQEDQDSYRLEYVTSLKHNRYINVTNQDFHVLGKSQLGAMIANSC